MLVSAKNVKSHRLTRSLYFVFAKPLSFLFIRAQFKKINTRKQEQGFGNQMGTKQHATCLVVISVTG